MAMDQGAIDIRYYGSVGVNYWLLRLSGERKAWLLWQQTISVSPSLTFHALPLKPDLNATWVIANFTSGFINPTEDERVETLAAILKGNWLDPEFGASTDRLMTMKEGPSDDTDSVAIRAVNATKSWNLTIVRHNPPNDTSEPDPSTSNRKYVFQLTGHPLTTNHREHEKWCQIIKKKTYTVFGYMTVSNVKQTLGTEAVVVGIEDSLEIADAEGTIGVEAHLETSELVLEAPPPQHYF
ncbi:hypothetical protein K435DRAFT_804201 [Dendrothele bispora CBS 962.96]|uniref:Uncharacterized protein n=1 Tax=Dendrothele bispora (strain CBS 962.96) TaxID=1314807 RepID=A0A4S8LF31_DENBC|nr:hypothetical protein K435DRAFT_804201 [Dendrothele bispora CBS 962.96]